MSKVLQERGFGSLPSSTEANPRDHVKSISTTIEAGTNLICRASVSVMPLSTYLSLGLGELAHTKLTVELADRTVKYPKGIAENVLVGIGKFVFPVDFIILDMPEDVKVPLILGRPFLSTAHAKIDVFKRKITLRVGDEKIIFKSVKPASSLIKRVYMLSLRERMELDLEARLMGETLVLNRSLDPLYGDYIELNDFNVLLELRRDQVDDFMPTIKEGEVIDEPMIDIIKTRNDESFDEYPSFCDFDRKIHIDCAYNLRFSCMIVVENMDGYRDQDIGDIILEEPLCKASCVEARRFDGLITIHNGFSIWRIPVYGYDDLARKEINEVGEISII
ncbi:putative reverse transcriptase domain-containing protein [Tanacetum coccineum]